MCGVCRKGFEEPNVADPSTSKDAKSSSRFLAVLKFCGVAFLGFFGAIFRFRPIRVMFHWLLVLGASGTGVWFYAHTAESYISYIQTYLMWGGAIGLFAALRNDSDEQDGASIFGLFNDPFNDLLTTTEELDEIMPPFWHEDHPDGL